MLMNTTFLEDSFSIKWQTRGENELGFSSGQMYENTCFLSAVTVK